MMVKVRIPATYFQVEGKGYGVYAGKTRLGRVEKILTRDGKGLQYQASRSGRVIGNYPTIHEAAKAVRRDYNASKGASGES